MYAVNNTRGLGLAITRDGEYFREHNEDAPCIDNTRHPLWVDVYPFVLSYSRAI